MLAKRESITYNIFKYTEEEDGLAREMVIVLDFGGQYNQLIARRVRECNVYCEVHPYTLSLEKIKEMNPRGIIFTGGPNSVYDEASPHYQKEIFETGIPILGICYGSQLIAWSLGGKVETAPVSEYGHTEVEVDHSSVLFKDVEFSRRSCTQRRDIRCSRDLCMMYADVRETGRWALSWRRQSGRSGRR